ncbi:uncharacterized protein LOC122382512 [Amphibalanus amphitrite]|uniref:uncharacterized protein LOC122382512 n=1 Tax=Amphibalanus amphitrite TaxID=1232801 RepID=UPI001C922501|nr:uncharacterized protein LOC122382512 [Amphibalanus amphitrite]
MAVTDRRRAFLQLLLLLLLLATLLPSTDALFNFGVDLYPDFKGPAPFKGGPLLTPLALTIFACAVLAGQYGFLPIRISDAVAALRRYRQRTRLRRLRRHLYPEEPLDITIRALQLLDEAIQLYSRTPYNRQLRSTRE